MDRLSLLVLPRARPSLAPPATAPLNARQAAAAAACRTVRPRRGSRTAPRRWPVSAVAAETPRTEEPPRPSGKEARFDWLDQWYPLAPVCDLDPRAPHGKTVLGLAVVAWFDRAAGEWRVFDDACPHRLAPLSEGRIDDKGRLQCVYHGWCFDGRGACQFIPQAPALGPPVHKNSKACVAAYPSVVQNNILWFYPRSEPEHRDVLQRKRPPYIPEIDDPSFITVYGNRDFLYGRQEEKEGERDCSYTIFQATQPRRKPLAIFQATNEERVCRETRRWRKSHIKPKSRDNGNGRRRKSHIKPKLRRRRSQSHETTEMGDGG